MWSRLTVIGVIIASVIIAVGVASLVIHLGPIEIHEQHTLGAGEVALYSIPAPEGTEQSITLAGDRFNVTLSSPGEGGLQIDNAEYRETATLLWTHEQTGDTRVSILNTGSGDLVITPQVVRSSDPIWIAFDFMVIISGIIIIGFSMGFAARRPKGF